MGIKGLGKFIGDFAPRSIKRQEAAAFASRVVAIDASMSLYQFLVSIRESDSFGCFTNEAGECTSHIAGMLNRAIRLLEQGIKPVYVFDGEPPELKAGELAKRRGVREAAAAAAAAAKEAGDTEEMRKQVVRALRVEKKHAADVQQLLRLMGMPVVQAPGEAEAQCAELTKHNVVWATATEDADALTFGATRLIRNLTFGSERGGGSGSSSSGSAVLLISLQVLLEELQFSQQQFVDFCILCGCDYCGTVRGVGAKTAYSLLKEHGSLDAAIAAGALEKEKLPEPFPYEEVRALFLQPKVTPATDVRLIWSDVDVEGLRKFLVQENQFNEQRVENYILRLKKARSKALQTRLESFFGAPTVKPSSLLQKQQLEQQLKKNQMQKRKTTAKASASRGQKRERSSNNHSRKSSTGKEEKNNSHVAAAATAAPAAATVDGRLKDVVGAAAEAAAKVERETEEEQGQGKKQKMEQKEEKLYSSTTMQNKAEAGLGAVVCDAAKPLQAGGSQSCNPAARLPARIPSAGDNSPAVAARADTNCTSRDPLVGEVDVEKNNNAVADAAPVAAADGATLTSQDAPADSSLNELPVR